MFFYCLIVKPNKAKMGLAVIIRGESKKYKADNTAITALKPTIFNLLKKELTSIIAPSG